MSKIDLHKYETVQDFLDDIELIAQNALEYNPDTDAQGKQIKFFGAWQHVCVRKKVIAFMFFRMLVTQRTIKVEKTFIINQREKN